MQSVSHKEKRLRRHTLHRQNVGHFRKVKGREAKRCRAVQLKEKVDTDSTDKWPSQKMSITESKSEKESERPLITSDTLVQLLVMFPKFPLKFSHSNPVHLDSGTCLPVPL